MNKQQVLQMMGLEQLPKASNSPIGKCIALVDRAGGDQDYVIYANGGIVADKNPVSAVRKVVEFYPVVKEKKVTEVEAEVESEPQVVVEPEVVKVTPEYNRDEAVKFLVSKGMSEAKMKSLSEDDIKKRLKVYGR